MKPTSYSTTKPVLLIDHFIDFFKNTKLHIDRDRKGVLVIASLFFLNCIT